MKGVRTPYPEPFLRGDRQRIYYFSYVDPRTGKRHQRSTGCSRKADAVSEIKKFVDGLSVDDNPAARKSFGEYSADFFIDGKCPRQARLIGDGKTFGQKHMYDQRLCLVHVIGREGDVRKRPLAPMPFSRLLLGKITREDPTFKG